MREGARLTVRTMQSSAYVPLWLHGIRRHRSSLAMRRAIAYRLPSFSSSASTHPRITGVQDAYNLAFTSISTHSYQKEGGRYRFISPSSRSILPLTESTMKFVSTITE